MKKQSDKTPFKQAIALHYSEQESSPTPKVNSNKIQRL